MSGEPPQLQLQRRPDQVIVCAALGPDWDSKGYDSPSIVLPEYPDKLIAAVAAVNENTVILTQTGMPVEMPWLENVCARSHRCGVLRMRQENQSPTFCSGTCLRARGSA